MNDFAHQQRTNTEHLSDCGHSPRGEDLPACLFVQTVEQSPVAISITDAKANILYVNPAFTQVTGYTEAEAVGCNESMLSDKRTPPAVYEGLWSTLQRKEVWRGHLINRHKAGRPYLADLLIAPVLDGEGRTTHYVGLHRDATELHGLEQTVRNQKVLIESVIDALPVAAVLLDEEGRVVLDNLAYKSLVSDLSVKEPVRLFLERLEAELGEEWFRLCEAKRPFKDKEVCFERGGSRPARWYSCAGTWFVNGDDSVDGFFHNRRQTYLLLVLSDISRLKRQQEEIRLSAIKSLTAEEEKTGSLREALSAAIHQMQGPMNMLGAVKGMLERRGDPANAGLLDLLGQVLAQGEESVATLQSCLPQGDGQAFVPVNLNRILRDTLEVETERLLAAGIEVDWQPSPVLPAVAGVESRLRSLFKQLLDNAINSLSRPGTRQRELKVGTAADGDVVRVWVEDSGPGIAPELRLKVFEPFFTARGGGRGAGMGLALAQDVVNQHGGMIRVAPDCSSGCRMEVHFHACGEAAENRVASHA